MSNSVNAFAAFEPKKPLRPHQIQRRIPEIHDVQIEIHYCGVCHSDIHQVNDDWRGGVFPMVPGHEIVGKVTQVGSAVKKFKIGDHVGVGCMVDSCRTCSPCREGLEQYCQNGASYSYTSFEQDKKTPTYGGYSKQITTHEDFVLKIPNNLPLDKAAPLLCAGITTYSPLRQWKVKAKNHVAIVGLGGLGHMGVKLAAAMGAEVTAISSSQHKKEDALRLGAKHFMNSSNPDEFKKNMGRFDFILNTVSSGIDLSLYLTLLKLDATMVQVGAPEKPNTINVMPLIGGRRRLAGSLIGGIAETQEMLNFCGEHNITSDIELIQMNDINKAYERVLKSDVRYRFVIDIKSF